MDTYPVLFFVLAVLGGALLGLGLWVRRQIITFGPSNHPISASVVNDYMSKLDATLELMADVDAKKGRKDSPEWLEEIEDLEGQVNQPQRYHAAPESGIPGAWVVGYVDDEGVDRIARYSLSEEMARYWAAQMNLLLQSEGNSARLQDELQDPFRSFDLIQGNNHKSATTK